MANVLQRTISILASNGDGTLRKAEKQPIGTGAKGIDSMGVADIDNDGDLDIVGTRFADGGVAVFRNITDASADPVMVEFEPLESFGVAQASVFDRAPIVLANFDNDTSGPDGEGTIDIVAIPKSNATINVLTNTLVDGGHRIALDGTNQFTNLNFIVKPAVIPPTLDPIPGPVVMDEDETYTVSLSGISIGREDSADFRITALSSHPEIIPDQVVSLLPGQSETSFVLAPVLNANTGVAPNQTPVTITVEARNAGPGAEAVFGDDDDGVTRRSFTVTVNPVNDPPTFTLPAELPPVSQKAGPQSINGFVTEIKRGGGDDEAGQTLLPFVVSADTSFFDVPPAIDLAGRLTFDPSDERSGPVPVTVSLSDSGGVENGGNNTSSKTFIINILPVNDPPAFNLRESQVTVRADAGAQTHPGFAYGFDPGGGTDEDSQTVSDYLVVTETPGLFEVLPRIDRNGLLTFTPAADRSGTTDVTVRVRDSGGTDNMGTDLSQPITFQITIDPVPDTTSPVPVLTSTAPAITNQSSFDVVVRFGEPVQSFSATDVTVVGGSARTLIDLGGGSFVVPIDATPGNVQVSIAAAVVEDLAGNPNFASDTLTRTVNTNALVPALSSTSTNPTNANSILVDVDFGREVSGFELTDVVVDGTSTVDFNVLDASQGRYRLELSVEADGDISAVIPAGVATDAAGNHNVASSLFERTIDRSAPQPTLRADVASPTNQSNFFVDIDFGETVEGFELADLTISGAIANQFRSLGSGRYSVLVTASDGEVSIGIDAAVAIDLAGNENSAGLPLQVSVDTSGVTPILSSSAFDRSNLSEIPVTIDFGDEVIGFEASDVLVLGGSVSEFSAIDSANGRYAVKVIPSNDGLISVIIPPAVAIDVPGNFTSESQPLMRTIDQTPPQAALLVANTTATESTVVVTVEFTEPIVGFDETTLVHSGGEVDSAVANENLSRFVVTLINIPDGRLELSLPTAAVTDEVGNQNLAAESVEVLVDTVGVDPTITSSAPLVSNLEAIPLSIEFGETVIGFESSDLVIVNGSVSEFAAVDVSTGHYQATVVPSDDGSVGVIIPGGAAADAAGNPTGASAPFTRTVDRSSPRPTLRVLGASSTRETSLEIQVNFSEPVLGFDSQDLVLSSGSVQSIIENNGGQDFIVVVSAIDDGSFTSSLAAGVVTDAAGNASTAASSNEVLVDAGSPTPTLSATETTDAGVFSLTISFDEDVQGLSEQDFILSGVTLAELSGSGRSYTATMTVDPSVDAWIQLPEDSVGDAFGNRNIGSNRLTLSQAPDSIVLTSAGETVDMASVGDSLLSSVVRIDIRGTGSNTLLLDASKIQSLTPDQTLLVISDSDDTVTFDAGWEYSSASTVDGQFERLFTHGESTLRLVGPLAWTNPINPFDVNGNGIVSALDALFVVNAIARGAVVDQQSNLNDPTTLDAASFQFYDVNSDQRLTVLDALQVINHLANQSAPAESESIVSSPVRRDVPEDSVFESTWDWIKTP